MLFNPLDSHTCEQIDDKALDWRCLNIENDIMRQTASEITGSDYIERNFAETITLADLSKVSGLNNYTLLRNFTVQRGITPYQVLPTKATLRAFSKISSG